jgi:tetratricopeptide (TPR) repeat protein
LLYLQPLKVNSKMKKTIITFLASGLLLITGLKAQTIPEGMNHLYADRFKSAVGIFEKLLATNPNNIEATYWLGQTYFDMDNNAAARQLYEKALATNGSAPLILVGLGHADLLDNKTNDARQKFEAAITAATTKKGPDQMVLTAIGRANVDAKSGDYNYAIQKLEQAADKGEKNTETLLQLGNAYRKAGEGRGGGDAYKSYKKALEINQAFAVADLRLAKLFESQKNWELVLEYLNDAIKRDAKFTPAYYELFYYYFYREKYPEAEEQLKKYIDSKTPETDSQDQFLYAQLCWAHKDYTCAVAKAESVVIAMGAFTKPKVFRLLADSYFSKGEFPNAKKYSDEFFAKKKADDITLYDYQLRASILDKTGGTVDEVYNTYIQGISIDTLVSLKIDFVKKGAEAFKAKGDSISRNKEGDLRMEILKLKPNYGQRELFDAGFAYYQGKNYEKADSLFDVYSIKYPEETFGWMMQYNIHRTLDSTMEKGAAIPAAVKYLSLLEKDTVKNKSTIIGVAGYLAQYYANITKDKAKALEYLRKMLALDPNNVNIQNNISILEKAPAIKPPATPKGNTPPAKAAEPKSVPGAKSTSVSTTKTTVAKN